MAHGLWSAGSVVVAHGLSCSAACGIFPDQGLNPCPLHWHADSFFLNIYLFMYVFMYLFMAMLGLPCCAQALVAVSGGATLPCGVRALVAVASCGARALGAQASVVAAHSLSSCGTRALKHRLSSCGARA